MLTLGQAQFAKKDILICALGVMLSFAVMLYKNQDRTTHPEATDGVQYIGAAYNLAHHGVKNDSASLVPPSPSVGREPAYIWTLVPFFWLDDNFDRITPECLRHGCDAEIYRHALYFNFLQLALVGVVMYGFLLFVTQSRLAGVFGGCAIWLNFTLQKPAGYIASDVLALFLVTLLTVSIYLMLTRQSRWFAAISGLLFALLVLDKAIFYYLLPVFAVSLLVVLWFDRKIARRQQGALFLLFVFFAGAPILSWMQRNHTIDGQWRLTEHRGAIGLQARAIFNEMSPGEYFASFVYWTRSTGDSWAEKFIDKKHWQALELYHSQGYNIRGHELFPQRVRALRDEGASKSQAERIAFDEIKREVLSHPVKHVLVSVPLLWRGLQIDDFYIFSLPGLVFALIYLVRNRQQLPIYALSFLPAYYTLGMYALVSISLPRYFLPAMPLLSFAAAVFLTHLIVRVRKTRHREYSSG